MILEPSSCPKTPFCVSKLPRSYFQQAERIDRTQLTSWWRNRAETKWFRPNSRLPTAHQQSVIGPFGRDPVFHHGLELSGSRLAMPLRLEVHVHLAKTTQAQDNLPGRLNSAAATLHVSVDGEHRDTD